MFYLDFLRALHDRLSPRTYLEIGVAQGHSLGLARCRSIGIDPAFQVDQELVAPVSLLRSTSDEYFARLEAEGTPPFGGLPIDFAYIDGMHLLEYALRDFIGVEQYSARSSVVAFDDVLPRNVEEAARDRHVMPWTGDVFRIPLVLTEHRPDLVVLSIDTKPAGTLLVTGLDSENRLLAGNLDDIVREYVMPDPQPIPREILERQDAMTPDSALALRLWDELRVARQDGESARPLRHGASAG